MKKLLVVMMLGLVVGVVGGCGDKKKDPLSSSTVDTDELLDALSISQDYFNGFVFKGLIANGKPQSGIFQDADDVLLYELRLSKAKEVLITLDGEDDIKWAVAIIKSNGEQFDLIEENDEDDNSPVPGYVDRSRGLVFLEKGSYFISLRCLGFVDRTKYRLEVSW